MEFFAKLFQAIVKFFPFNSEAAKKRLELRAIAKELGRAEPALYKNGFLRPSFADMVFLFYSHSKSLGALLNDTLFSKEPQTLRLYQSSLFLTGFTAEMRALYESFNYEQRKAEARENPRAFEVQRKKFEALIKQMGAGEFPQIDGVITQLQQLRDLCSVNCVAALSSFDRNFQGVRPSYRPVFQNAPLGELEGFITELYYYSADFQITGGLSRAIFALDDLLHRRNAQDEEARKTLLAHLKTIRSILTGVLTPAVLEKLYKLLKADLTVTLEKAVYAPRALSVYVAGLKETFESDTLRIKTEIQNDVMAAQIQALFEDRLLQQIGGYNADTDACLKERSSLSLLWVMPFRVLKSFLVIFFDDQIQSLLNDIAIEGFFNVQTYKSEFSALVYNCCGILGRMNKFESKFTQGDGNYDSLIHSHLADSRKDETFMNTLALLVDTINKEAKSILATNCRQLHELRKRVDEILGDAKKPNQEFISNIKMLFASVRNRDKLEHLERILPKWDLFFNIMTGYGILTGPAV
ncbi:MAG: DUF5312 domain-containing protein [Spirochaetaceae bacterium]|jgi:hypothetical protein|nr:DUF5312 domain-containing protein [Spirochaetaceae bacterium]